MEEGQTWQEQFRRKVNDQFILGSVGSLYVVGQNEIQVKMKFLCHLTQIIHGS